MIADALPTRYGAQDTLESVHPHICACCADNKNEIEADKSKRIREQRHIPRTQRS